jgi:hypothetical protein
VAEQLGRLRKVVEHGFQHAVVEQGGDRRALGCRQGLLAGVDPEGDAAFYPLDGPQPAVPGDVGGFRRPRRDGADTRRDQEEFLLVVCVVCRPGLLGEQLGELPTLAFAECAAHGDEVPVVGRGDANPGDVRHGDSNALLQGTQTERRKRGGAAEKKDIGHGGRAAEKGRQSCAEGKPEKIGEEPRL